MSQRGLIGINTDFKMYELIKRRTREPTEEKFESSELEKIKTKKQRPTP